MMENNMFKADLHCHTTYSDGTFTPTELLTLAKEKGLQGLAITDHDTTLAYGEAVALAKKMEISLISGIEFSSQHAGHTIHVLGYSFTLGAPSIEELCRQHVIRRRQRNLAILDKLKEKGMVISEAELITVAGDLGSIGRPHIAMLLVKKGYVKDVREAFRSLIGDGQCCYVHGKYPTTKETIDVIHQGGGMAVIAHPHLLKNRSLFAELKTLPFDGIEAHYARFPGQMEQEWVAAAHEKGWLITGGSDFHGTDRPENTLGSSWTPEESFDILQALYLKNQIAQ